MKKVLFILIIFYSLMFVSSKNSVSSEPARMQLYGLKCHNQDTGTGNPCNYSTWWEAGCTKSDPYNFYVMCPQCFHQWLDHKWLWCPY